MKHYTLSQFLFASLLSAAYASAAVALIFLISDGLRGQLLFTPSLMGSVILLGDSPSSVSSTRIDMVGLYGLMHFGAFVVVGTAGTILAARFPLLRRNPVLHAGLLVLVLSGGMGLLDGFLSPGLVNAAGPLVLVVANVAAAAVMTWFIHATLERSLLARRRPVPVSSRRRPR